MRKLFALFTVLLVAFTSAFTFTSCTSDGLVDSDAMKNFARKLEQKVPTKDEFRNIAEKRIDQMPADEQPKARQELEKTLADWPTDTEISEAIDNAIDEFTEKAPSKADVEDALDKFAKEMPSKAEMKDAVDGIINKIPEGDELGSILKKGLNEFVEALDSIKVEVEKD